MTRACGPAKLRVLSKSARHVDLLVAAIDQQQIESPSDTGRVVRDGRPGVPDHQVEPVGKAEPESLSAGADVRVQCEVEAHDVRLRRCLEEGRCAEPGVEADLQHVDRLARAVSRKRAEQGLEVCPLRRHRASFRRRAGELQQLVRDRPRYLGPR